ncbi:hypothetical protein RF55_16388 [Lasius niger]|uniref:Uncharacterized protein n=1 Tax=Lasius niger TaxID=67767 RepID=A0A0J7K4T6_LASNI|nr:hypothetical protein RF55_16388 [Lasius niger]
MLIPQPAINHFPAQAARNIDHRSHQFSLRSRFSKLIDCFVAPDTEVLRHPHQSNFISSRHLSFVHKQVCVRNVKKYSHKTECAGNEDRR